MWTVDSLELREVTFDYRSAGLGFFSTYAVHSGDICLINNIGRVDFTDDFVQVFLCNCCGFPHCESGGCVSLRRAGDSILWIPAFCAMEHGDWELGEYTPPKFIRQHGIAVFDATSHADLVSKVDGVPKAEDVLSLTCGEAVALIQWNAPFSVLGEFPAPPSLDRQRILAATDGDASIECDAVQEFLSLYRDSNAPIELVEVATSAVEFHLDDPGCTEWIPCHRSKESLVFYIDGLGVFGTPAST